MRIWLITIGEPLPLRENVRLLRTGIFANHLIESGHDVTWWTSTFDHVSKSHVASGCKKIRLNDNFSLFLLRGCGYQNNVSFARLYDHYLLGKKFRENAENEEKPEVVLCSFPAIELSAEAVRYGKTHGVPVILDVRDLWPDIFLDFFPGYWKFVGRLFLYPLLRLTKTAFRGASTVTGVTKPFVEWGVGKSGRCRRTLDQDFPMGYPEVHLEHDEIHKTNIFWEKYGIDGKRFLIVFFGYFGRQFDLRTILKAAKKLKLFPVDFVLCGDGDSFEEFVQMGEQLPNVVFPGWVGQAEIAALMRMGNVGIMPYWVKDDFLKSIPNKFIEYLSAGLPILTTLHGEVGSLLLREKCGYVYKSETELVALVKKLVEDDKKVKQMAKASKELFNAQFKASKVYSKMEQYLVDVIDYYNNGKT